MFGDINPHIKPKKLDVFLCTPQRKTIGKLNEAYAVMHSVRLSDINELSFTIPYYVKDSYNNFVRNENVDKIKERFLLKVLKDNKVEYYIITGVNDASGKDSDVRNVKAFSLGYQTKDKVIRTYSKIGATAKRLMTDALDGTLWSIGDNLANDTHYFNTDGASGGSGGRTFEVTSITVLDFIQQIATAFNAVIVWDTVNMKVDFELPENVGDNKGLKFSYGKYLQSLGKDSSTEEMVTRLTPFGRDELTIHSYNPTGSGYIEDFSYFMFPFMRDEDRNVVSKSNYMSNELCHALLDYKALVQENEEIFRTLLSEKTTLQNSLNNSMVELFTKESERLLIIDRMNAKKATGTGHSLIVENEQISVALKKDNYYAIMVASDDGSIAIDENGYMNIPTQWKVYKKPKTVESVMISSSSYALVEIVDITEDEYNGGYTAKDENGVDVQHTITDTDILNKYCEHYKQEQIDHIQVDIDVKEEYVDDVNIEIEVLRNLISVENNFTPELIVERDFYIIEKEWTNDALTSAGDLYVEAQKEFEKIRTPQMVFNIDIVNFLEVVEESRNWSKLNNGDTVNIKHELMGIDITAKIIEIVFDYDNKNINLKIANTKDIETDEDKLTKILYGSISSSATIQMNKFKWDKVNQHENSIDDLINSEWDAVKKKIVAGTNESVEISRRGILITNPDEPDRYLIANHGVLAITKSGGKTWEHAITADGIIGDRIIGKILIGENLLVENSSGTFKVDSNGVRIDRTSLTISNGTEESTFDEVLDSTSLTAERMLKEGRLDWYPLNSKWSSIQSGLVNWSVNDTTTSLLNSGLNIVMSNDDYSNAVATPIVGADRHGNQVNAVQHSINNDGTVNISFEWDFVSTGISGDIDGFMVFMMQSNATTQYSFGTSKNAEKVFYIAPEKRSIIFYGLPSSVSYTFGVRAYRIVKTSANANNIVMSSIIKSLDVTENPYIPKNNVAFSGYIDGTVDKETMTEVTAIISKLVQQGVSYNNVVIDSNSGLVATRSDNKIRTVLNATDGIKVQRNVSNSWNDLFYADTNGVLHARGLKINADDGTGVLIDAVTKTVDFSKFTTVVGRLNANNIIVGGDTTFESGYNPISLANDAEQNAKDFAESIRVSIQGEVDELTTSLNDLDTEINTTFKDGIITEAEAKAIQTYINVLGLEKSDLDRKYNSIYNDPSLTAGATKTALSTSKTNYNTAHANLLSSINTAISDGKATLTEKADVDAKFALYKNRLELLVEAIESSIRFIENAKSSTAENNAKQYTDTRLGSYVTATLYQQDIADIQSQIDGNITTWFYPHEPTLSNLPASDWTTIDLKNIHLGDIFYDDNNGYAYRFAYNGTEYQWVRISDVDVTKALQDASKAQDTADSKRRVFFNQPIPPYDRGDLWSQGTAGDIMICQVAKATGSYSSLDWVKASKYTDDTRAIEAEANAKTYADSLKSTIDAEIDDVITSITDLDTEINNSFRDGIISESEAKAIEKYLNIINSEKSDIDSRYNTIYVDTELTGTSKTTLATKKTAYNTAHTNLLSSINTAISDGKTTSVEKTDVDNKFASYRTALSELSVAFEVAIDTIAQTKATKSLTDANTFTQTKIDEVNSDITDVDDRVTGLKNFTDTAFADGVVTRAEKEALKSNIEQLNNEKTDVDNRYNSIYADLLLDGVTKTNLLNAKNGLNTAHTNLINSINTAVADSTITPAERTDVTSKYTAYRTALATLTTRFEESIRYIETKKVDNIQVGGRNYALASNVEKTSSSIVEYNLNRSGFEALIGKNVTVSFEAKANVDGIHYVDSYLRDGGTAVNTISNAFQLSEEYTRHSYTFVMPDTKARASLTIALRGSASANSGNSGTFTARNIKVEYGNKATDWNPAPDDVDSAIAVVQADIDGVEGMLTSLDTEIKGTFKDGIITETEANSIGKYINTLNAEKLDLDSRYNIVYVDTFLTGTAKTSLATAKTNYNTAHSSLISSINTAIADGKASSEEKTDVDTKFGTYRTRISELSSAFEIAISSIVQAKADKALTDANNFTQTKINEVNADIGDVETRLTSLDTEIKGTFKDGVVTEAEAKAISKYINSLNTEKADLDSRFNSIYVDSFLTGTAKTNVNNAKTAYNTAHTNLITSINTAISDGKTTTTESADVDSKFTLYRTALSTLSTRFEEAIRSIENAKAQDAKNYTDGLLVAINQDIGELQSSVGALESEIGTSFKDGIIQESEAIAIGKYINTLNTEKEDINNSYTVVYADTSLTGTPKTNLQSAKTSYDTAHTNLINSINNAIADKKATTAESADVDSKFTSYRTALATLATRFAEATKAIEDKKKQDAIDHANNKDTTVRTDLRLTASLPTSISLNANGITATTANSSNFARLDHRGLYVQGGAIDIRTSETSNRGVVFDANGIKGYNSGGVQTFGLDTNGNFFANNASFSGHVNATSGTFSGTLQGANGTFTGTLTGNEITGATISSTSGSIYAQFTNGEFFSRGQNGVGQYNYANITGGQLKLARSSTVYGSPPSSYDFELYSTGMVNNLTPAFTFYGNYAFSGNVTGLYARFG